jgi:hypothetical protein
LIVLQNLPHHDEVRYRTVKSFCRMSQDQNVFGLFAIPQERTVKELTLLPMFLGEHV